MTASSSRRGIRLTALAALALTAVPATSIATTTKGGPISARLVGRWAKNLTAAELTRAGNSASPGVYTMVLKRSGDFDLYFPGGTAPGFSSVMFAPQGDRLAIHVPGCFGGGIYAWKRSGRLLTFRKVRDVCSSRVVLFVGTWKRR